MPSTDEQELLRPLSCEEIATGVAAEIGAAVYDKVSTGKLFGNAFPAFRAELICPSCGSKAVLRLHLDNFLYDGVVSNYQVEAGNPSVTVARPVDIEVEVEKLPPNKFRRKTNQAIPTLVTENGQSSERRLKYARRVAKDDSNA